MAGRTTAALTVAICLPFLAACVGGGAAAVHLHDDAVRTEPRGTVGIDSWSPVLTVDNTTYVGSGVVESLGIALVTGGQEGIQGLRERSHGDARVFHGRVRNGVGRDRLVQYLREDARFTGLESWAADAAPGAAGTGSRWGDGDLGYGIEVGGNQFWATSGGDGIVDGSFFGIAHEGMGGVVKREDLTAAFGGSR